MSGGCQEEAVGWLSGGCQEAVGLTGGWNAACESIFSPFYCCSTCSSTCIFSAAVTNVTNCSATIILLCCCHLLQRHCILLSALLPPCMQSSAFSCVAATLRAIVSSQLIPAHCSDQNQPPPAAFPHCCSLLLHLQLHLCPPLLHVPLHLQLIVAPPLPHLQLHL